jgi:antitoxin HicB
MNYSIAIEWSDDDQCYVVVLPEWADRYAMPCSEGNTYKEALQSAKDALEAFIDLARKDNLSLPAPPPIYIRASREKLLIPCREPV